MHRIAGFLIVSCIQLVIASAALGATISIAPTSGPVGTTVTFTGVVTECSDEAAGDVEVHAGSARTIAELEDAGAVNGTLLMRDVPPSFPAQVAVHMRCVDAHGAPDGDDITEVPATFTYTAGPALVPPLPAPIDGPAQSPLPDPCASLQGARPETPLAVLLQDLDACLQVVLRGSGLDNTLFGNVLANVISGLGGDDVLHGLAGNDVVRGGLGADRTYGDGGDDRLFGDAGEDLVVGGAGSDALTGGAGHDSLQGGAGNDTLRSDDATAHETVNGGPGTDRCTVDRGDSVRGCERVTTR